jgi:hypothetical protein
VRKYNVIIQAITKKLTLAELLEVLCRPHDTLIGTHSELLMCSVALAQQQGNGSL